MNYSTTGCARTSCTKKDRCVLYANYLRQLADSEVLNLINDEKIVQTDAGCDHFTVTEVQRFAYGFKWLAGTIPAVNIPLLQRDGEFSSGAMYYRSRRGQRGMSPAAQEKFLALVKRLGGDPSVPFDRYHDEVVLVKG